MDEEHIEWLNEAELPAPRLQMRWRKPSNKSEERFGGETWVCVYELVLARHIRSIEEGK